MRTVFAAALVSAAILTGESFAVELPKELAGIRFDQRLNAQLPLDLTFTDDRGQNVRLKDYFHGKPVILVLAYYQCPRLCTLVLNSLVQGLLEIPYIAGREFEVVVLSFDPREDWHLAAEKKRAYLQRYGRPGSEDGWHFLTGDEANIRQLADAVGFTYRFDEQKNQFIHASGIMVVTPEGKLSRYLYDVRYAGRDLRMALSEASQGKIGSQVEQILLFCFHYDATLGKYSANIMVLVRLLGIATMFGIGWYVWRLTRPVPSSLRSGPKPLLEAGAAE
jgi:protein SCO1/2